LALFSQFSTFLTIFIFHNFSFFSQFFSDRHVPAEVEFFHGLDYCLKVQDALVPTLLGNVVSAYYADSLFGVNDPANMADIMSP
jgi:hypothetical protein